MNIDDFLKYSISKIRVGLYSFRLNNYSAKIAKAKRHTEYNETMRLKYRDELMGCNYDEIDSIEELLDCAYYRKKFWENKLLKLEELKCQAYIKHDKEYANYCNFEMKFL